MLHRDISPGNILLCASRDKVTGIYNFEELIGMLLDLDHAKYTPTSSMEKHHPAIEESFLQLYARQAPDIQDALNVTSEVTDFAMEACPESMMKYIQDAIEIHCRGKKEAGETITCVDLLWTKVGLVFFSCYIINGHFISG